MRTIYLVSLTVFFVLCLVCGLVLYALCVQRIYRKYMTRCRLRTTHDVVSRWLGSAPERAAPAIERAPDLPYTRLLLLDDQQRCWMDTLIPHLALDPITQVRPGPPLNIYNENDATRHPLTQLIDMATRSTNGGFVEYENNLGESKEWVYAFGCRLPQHPQFVLCVEWTTARGG